MPKGWGGTLLLRDYPILAQVFGFRSVEEFLDFAAEQQAKFNEEQVRNG